MKMRRYILVVVAILGIHAAYGVGALQQPLNVADEQGGLWSSDDEDYHEHWRLDFTSAAPHLFSSVYSLLQQMGNTIFPNGHTIAPCEIPPYTLFYHGRTDGELPPSPEW